MTIGEKDLLEHSWRYFQLHATQRITVFNFFVAASGLLVAGMIYSLRGGFATAPYSIAAGISLALLSSVFWKLDRRISDMIKSSEQAITKIEGSFIEKQEHRVMSMELQNSLNTKYSLFGNWTYGQAFRRIFLVVGTIGLLGTGLGSWQLWSSETVKPIQSDQLQSDLSLPIPDATKVGMGTGEKSLVEDAASQSVFTDCD